MRWLRHLVGLLLLALAVWYLAGIVYAVRGGLTAAELLGRTRGNWGFAAFYTLFVIACAIHAPIGVAIDHSTRDGDSAGRK